MTPPRTPRVTAEQAWLYREAERLTEMFCARLRAGDESEAEEFIRRRDEILQRIQETANPLEAADEAGEPEQYARESALVIGRIIELNQELVALLETRMGEVRKQLAELGLHRQSLTSYQGGSRADEPASFVDCSG
jgi:hypothetical protein